MEKKPHKDFGGGGIYLFYRDMLNENFNIDFGAVKSRKDTQKR